MFAVYDYQPSARGDPRVEALTNALDIGLSVMTPESSAILKAFPFCELSYKI